MQYENTGMRVGGVWLAFASILMVGALVLHGPIAAEPSDQMIHIRDRALAWWLAHWLAAAALSLFAVAGLLILTSRSILTAAPWARSAWAVLVVGGLWTLDTAVAEATVVTDAALSGSSEAFTAWWAFAEGKANGFSFLALALSVLAARDARGAPGVTPSWAAWAGMAVGAGSFAGWALGMWFEVRAGSLLWIVSSILVMAWAAWFGFGLSRNSRPVVMGAPGVGRSGVAVG